MGADNYYHSPAWRNLKAKALKASGWVCAQCGCGVRGSHCSESRPYVDHIKARKAGGADDLVNLQVLCHTCHSRKTAWIDNNQKPWTNEKGFPSDGSWE